MTVSSQHGGSQSEMVEIVAAGRTLMKQEEEDIVDRTKTT